MYWVRHMAFLGQFHGEGGIKCDCKELCLTRSAQHKGEFQITTVTSLWLTELWHRCLVAHEHNRSGSCCLQWAILGCFNAAFISVWAFSLQNLSPELQHATIWEECWLEATRVVCFKTVKALPSFQWNSCTWGIPRYPTSGNTQDASCILHFPTKIWTCHTMWQPARHEETKSLGQCLVEGHGSAGILWLMHIAVL